MRCRNRAAFADVDNRQSWSKLQRGQLHLQSRNLVLGSLERNRNVWLELYRNVWLELLSTIALLVMANTSGYCGGYCGYCSSSPSSPSLCLKKSLDKTWQCDHELNEDLNCLFVELHS